jgi:hypothetical protein
MEIIFDETRSKQIMVRVSESDFDFINQLAGERKIAQSTITRGFLEAAIREYRRQLKLSSGN